LLHTISGSNVSSQYVAYLKGHSVKPTMFLRLVT